MQIIALDFETYFADDYTLSKMTTESYVRDGRFEAHGAAVMFEGMRAEWYTEPALRALLAKVDWNATAIIAHHAQFDGLILSHHYGVRPKFWLDTLSMARLLLGNHLSVSLDSVRREFGMPAKRTPYELFKNKHWWELSPEVQDHLADGCEDEVESIWKLFGILAKQFPQSEYALIDQTVRMFTEPALVGDMELLRKIWMEEDAKKTDLLGDHSITAADVQSADRFADLLRAEGVEPATKKGKNGDIYAFAKTDDFMKELLEDDDPRISGLARARLGIKSTTVQTRAETIGWMASRGALCVYLRYCGAHTTRWSGGDRSNFQNFKRGNPLRNTLLAPEGHDLAIIDFSQVECRILNWLAGQWDVIEKFRNGEDPYVGLASEFYGRPITKADVAERGTGKQGELSCGYGCGGPKFRRTAALGIYGPPVQLTDQEAQRAVDVYRKTHKNVVKYWNAATKVLEALVSGDKLNWAPMWVINHRIYLPNGAPLIYDTLEWHANKETGEDGYRLKTRAGWTRMYGAKLVENVVQALARCIAGDAMAVIGERWRIVGMSHDELWVLIPKGDKVAFDWCLDIMRRPPAWAPDLPLDAEGSYGERYAK